MRIYLITYDLKQIGQNYSELYNSIKNLGDWRHPMESVWFVATNDGSMDSTGIYELLRPTVDRNDGLFVVNVTKADKQGWLPRSLWKWFEMNEI